MKNLRVLHVVPWFPNPTNQTEGVFIAKHILALQKHCENSVLHIQFTANEKGIIKSTYQNVPLTRIALNPRIDKWRFKEFLAARKIKQYLAKNHLNFDTVVFYIAYPNAINIAKLKTQFSGLNFILAEQWSAYHTQFNLSENNKGRQRIEHIFKDNTPLIVVSNALGHDIRNFTKIEDLPFAVVPNIVDEKSFYFKEKNKNNPFTFCSINNWSPMKNPVLLIDAFNLLQDKYPNTRLMLAGSGSLDETIKERVRTLGLTEKVSVKGRIAMEEVADLLHNSNAYCQSSNYETFSAICIEALATGTPVIATNIGGMKDFIDTENGVLVNTMDAETWMRAMEDIMLNYTAYDLQEISKNCILRFNSDKVGQVLYDTVLNMSHAK